MSRFTLLVFMSFFVASLTFAQDSELTKPIGKNWDKKKACSIDTPGGVLAVKMQGVNLCVASYLTREKGAKSQIKRYGCQPTFVVKKAFCINGDPLKEVKGWYVHYLKTDTCRPLFMKKARNRPLIVKGRLYIPQRMLEVTSFKLLKRKKKSQKIAEMVKKQRGKKKTAKVSKEPAVPWYEERLKEARKKLGLPADTPKKAKDEEKSDPKKTASKSTNNVANKKPAEGKTTVKPWYQERLEEAQKKLDEKKGKK